MGVKIPDFQVPDRAKIIDMLKRTFRNYFQIRSIELDVVVTERSLGLIEGNHDWCNLLWQLPVKSGLKSKLERV